MVKLQMLDSDLYTRVNDPDNGEDNLLFLACFNSIHAERYKLPQFGPFTDQLGEIFQPHLSEARTMHENAKLIQLDPALVVNFLNMTRSKYPSNSIPEAIAQMGEGTSYVYLQANNRSAGKIDLANNLLVQLSMALWEHSYLTGAFCGLAASHLRNYDPDMAMLAGLLHDIGTLPVLVTGSERSDLVSDPMQLDAIMRKLKNPITSLLCQRFKLPDFVSDAMVHSEDYHYLGQSRVDYAELVTVAHMAMDQLADAEIATFPVGLKISSQLRNSKTVTGLLAEAKEDLWETYRILEG